jgi:hypothetical protein
MSRGRIPINKNHELFTRDYNDDEERVDTLITKTVNNKSPTIIPQDRADFEHERAWKMEGDELLRKSNIAVSHIGMLMEELQHRGDLDNYFKFFELAKELLSAIDTSDYSLMITNLEIWNGVSDDPFVKELLSYHLYRLSKSRLLIDTSGNEERSSSKSNYIEGAEIVQENTVSISNDNDVPIFTEEYTLPTSNDNEDDEDDDKEDDDEEDEDEYNDDEEDEDNDDEDDSRGKIQLI